MLKSIPKEKNCSRFTAAFYINDDYLSFPLAFHLARDARRKRKLDLDNDLARTKQPSPLGTFRSFTIGVQPLSYKLVRLENVRVMIVRELR